MQTPAPIWRFHSALPGVAWPPVLSPRGAVEVSLLFQIEQSQWLAPEALLARQLAQLDVLVRHATATVPFYRRSWPAVADPAAALTAQAFSRLPILTRIELQEHFDDLKSGAVPPEHGEVGEVRSSGSTGTPVRVLKTTLCNVFWNAITLRDHRWHRRDLGAKMCSIRKGGAGRFDNWGPATAALETGPSAGCDVDVDYDAALRWLVHEAPAYLMTYPSIVAALAQDAIRQHVRLPGLREVRTFGEPLDDEVRELVRRAWQVPTSDSYSAEETGYLALRCPQQQRYHCQSESAFVEVLDDAGQPCGPGQRGRVVVTPLHNFAMPLVRYELGDHAEVGAACACGRHSLVLDRVLGRSRNTLVTPEGKRLWPVFGLRKNPAAQAIRQFQVVRKSSHGIEVRYVSPLPLTPALHSALEQGVQAQLPPGFSVSAHRVAAIERSASGKFEDFRSEAPFEETGAAPDPAP